MTDLKNVYFAFIFIAIGGLLFGYVIGINSDILTEGQLLCPESYVGAVGDWASWGYGQCYRLGPIATGTLSSLNLIGAVASSLVCFRYADLIGRKREMELAAVLYASGAVVTAAAPALWVVALGLLVYGLAVGFAMHAAPVFIAEIAPAEVRGALVAAKEAVIVLGIFLGFLAGYAFSLVGPGGWRMMILCAALLAVVMLCGLARLPRSPRYLVLQAVACGGCQELEEEALAALVFFRGDDSLEEARAELERLQAGATASLDDEGEAERLLPAAHGETTRQVSWLAAFKHGEPLLIGCGLVVLQQVTGQPSVLYYATNVFKSAGFGGTAALQPVLLGLVKLVATLFTVWRVDLYGRRLLLLVGIAMMAGALAVIAVGFSESHCTLPGLAKADCPTSSLALPPAWAAATLIALMVYVSGYQVGFGPISWLIISEIFPLKVRGSALSVAAIANFGSNIVVTFSTAELLAWFSPSGLFAAFLCMSLLSMAFVSALVPETKGKTLEELEAMMKA